MVKFPGHTGEPQSQHLNLPGAVIWAPSVFPYRFPKALWFTLLMELVQFCKPWPAPPWDSSDALTPQREKLPLSSMGRALSLLPGLPGALISLHDAPSLPSAHGNLTFSQRNSDPVIRQASLFLLLLEFAVSLCFRIKLPPLLLCYFTSSFFPSFGYALIVWWWVRYKM